MDSSTLILLTGPFSIEGVSSKFVLLQCFVEIPIFYANSIDPDQTPHSVASDLCLHCLPMSLLLNARHKLVIVVLMKCPGLFSGKVKYDYICCLLIFSSLYEGLMPSNIYVYCNNLK